MNKPLPEFINAAREGTVMARSRADRWHVMDADELNAWVDHIIATQEALERLQKYVLHEGHEECAAYGVSARKECYGCDDNWAAYQSALSRIAALREK